MRFQRPRRQDVIIDVTNLVDVVLLLLIFFMVSSSATESARLGIELPKAGNGVATAPQEPLVVAVDEAGGYAVNGAALQSRDADGLRIALSAAIQAAPGVPLVLIGDAKAPHQSVVTVMDVARGLGVGSLRIATRPERGAANGLPVPRTPTPVVPAPAPVLSTPGAPRG